MRFLFFAPALALLLSGAGCAGPRAYVGARGTAPRMEIGKRFHYDSVTDPRSPQWVARYTGHMINPTDRTIAVRVDCPLFIAEYSLPPRTVQDFLVEPGYEPGDSAPDCSFDFH